MLGKHPDEYPRFRDCFISDEDAPEFDDYIHVYTRSGGGNRDWLEVENEAMRVMETYVTDFDDDFDCTYASWIFEVPEKWRDDFLKFKEGKISEFSKEYKSELYRVYPKLKDKLNELLQPQTERTD